MCRTIHHSCLHEGVKFPFAIRILRNTSFCHWVVRAIYIVTVDIWLIVMYLNILLKEHFKCKVYFISKWCLIKSTGNCSSGSRISRRGGADLVGGGGCQLPRQLRFGKFVCQNERIWTHGGGRQRRPSGSATELVRTITNTI